jgi:site-specific DNA-methyltransferase (adenine-specific)
VLWCGRFQDAVWIPSESVDAIVTDPPYGREWLPLYEDLAGFAARVLKPGGVCLVMTGQLILPDVIEILRRRLQYVWLISYVSTGHAALVWSIRVMSHSKPVLYFAKPPHNPTGLFRPDLISSGQKTKREHEWQQSVAGFRRLIRHYTRPNSLILDPCCGTGTTLVAAIMEGEGRRAIGIDVDGRAIGIAFRKLEEASGGPLQLRMFAPEEDSPLAALRPARASTDGRKAGA